ncbi:FtsB family cell division protein [Nocardioides jishulii]|uniref:FtsB family cell division protein n=1 Tax=Nocardioides jishulii TaxID=2575440 RepID=UPI001EF0C431|nr:septum formation initiator family protein [Nocardioides jishulii]
MSSRGESASESTGSGPGRSSAAARGPRTVASRPPQPPGTRFTSRAAILLLVVLVLGVSYASSLRAYLDQRATIESTKAEIAQSEKAIAELEREKRRWSDDAYVKAQARQHLGYLMPGETGYQVLDENGEPLDSVAALADPDEVIKEEPVAWWETVWTSVELAGNPPPARPTAPKVIDGVKKNEQEKQ